VVDPAPLTVVFFPQTRAKSWTDVRLFKNLDAAVKHYGKHVVGQSAYRSRQDFVDRHDIKQLRKFAVDLATQFSQDSEIYHTSLIGERTFVSPHAADELIQSDNIHNIARAIWDLCQVVGDRVSGLPDDPANDDRYKIYLDKLASPEGRAQWGKLQKQARVIAEALIEANEPTMTQHELERFMDNLVLVEKLQTRQKPMLIWRYYGPILGELGFIYYPGRRLRPEPEVA
jgi:hypothetical protein